MTHSHEKLLLELYKLQEHHKVIRYLYWYKTDTDPTELSFHFVRELTSQQQSQLMHYIAKFDNIKKFYTDGFVAQIQFYKPIPWATSISGHTI